MQFFSKFFSELTTDELYEIIKSRNEIFIVEQGIRYQDLDGIDKKSLHCFMADGEKVVAYLRAFYKDENRALFKSDECSRQDTARELEESLWSKASPPSKKK